MAIKWFEMVQLGIPSAAISAFFGQILLSKKEITDLYCNQMKKIILNANNCKFIMNIYFEKEFETNLV